MPPTPKMNVYKIYSLFPYIDYDECENEPDKIYALKIDFSETSIILEDIYPFYLKINKKYYVLAHSNNFYELLLEKETFKSVLLLKQPRRYIENKPLTYDEVTNISE